MALQRIILLSDRNCSDWGILKTLSLLLKPVCPDVYLVDLSQVEHAYAEIPADNCLTLTSNRVQISGQVRHLIRGNIVWLLDEGESVSDTRNTDVVLVNSTTNHQAGNNVFRWHWPAYTNEWLTNNPDNHSNQFNVALYTQLPEEKIVLLQRSLEFVTTQTGIQTCCSVIKDGEFRLSQLKHADLIITDSTIDDADIWFYQNLFNLPSIALNRDQRLLNMDKGIAYLTATFTTLIENPLLRRRLVLNNRNLFVEQLKQTFYQPLETFLNSLNLKIDTNDQSLFDCFDKSRPDSFRIEGPFDTSYSLAQVNRYVALSLDQCGATTTLAPVEAIGNYPVDDVFYTHNPAVSQLVFRSEEVPSCDTVLRLMYPLRLAEMYGVNNGLCCYGWEESALPDAVVHQINIRLQIVTSMSSYVSTLLLNNGVYTPTFTTGLGADHILAFEPDNAELPDLGAGLKFLHISSCFPRKGIDVLLNAYGQAFRGADDVSLIIKTFPNPHHDIAAILSKWQSGLADPPAVIVINRDVTDSAIRYLYDNCHVLVAPSRGEGFGLPMAEAMLHHTPVITTGYGGQSDFCRDDTAWLIDYKFARAETHMGLMDSVWVDPDSNQLSQRMMDFFQAWKSNRWRDFTGEKTAAAFNLIDSQFRWRNVAQRIIRATEQLDDLPPISSMPLSSTPQLGVVTTWNSKCGIASYTKLLLEPAFTDYLILANRNAELTESDQGNVHRCWEQGCPEFPEALYNAIINARLKQVLFQFNFGFFSASGFKKLLEKLHQHHIQTFITCHSTVGGWQGKELVSLAALQPELSNVEKIFVHSINDLNYLKSFGVTHNTVLFPHGVSIDDSAAPLPQPVAEGIPRDRKIIASFGFLLPHKGLLQLIEAFELVLQQRSDVHLLLVNSIYPSEISETEAVFCRNLIRRRKLKDHVTLITDFLKHEESIALLRLADMIVFPYQKTSESASGAVRWGLASRKPVYCTPLNIFDDVSDAVTFLPGISPVEIAQGLERALALPASEIEVLSNRQNNWLNQHAWHKLSQRLKNVLRGAHLQSILTSTDLQNIPNSTWQ